MFKFFLDKSIIFVAPVLTFFWGWVYLNEFFETLCVAHHDLELNLNDIYVHAFSPFLSMGMNAWEITKAALVDISFWLCLAFLGATFLFLYLYATQGAEATPRRKLETAGAFALFFLLSYAFVANRAVYDARRVLGNCDRTIVLLTFAPDAHVSDATLLSANQNQLLRLIWQTNDFVYVVPVDDTAGRCTQPPQYVTDSSTSGGYPTYQLRRAQIDFMRIRSERADH